MPGGQVLSAGSLKLRQKLQLLAPVVRHKYAESILDIDRLVV